MGDKPKKKKLLTLRKNRHGNIRLVEVFKVDGKRKTHSLALKSLDEIDLSEYRISSHLKKYLVEQNSNDRIKSWVLSNLHKIQDLKTV